MAEGTTVFIDISDVRIGMYIYLDLNWLSHPFPSSSFKITNDKQLEVLQSLGLKRIRYSAEKSDSVIRSTDSINSPPPDDTADDGPLDDLIQRQMKRKRLDALNAQKQVLFQCEKRFSQATATFLQAAQKINSDPKSAREQLSGLACSMVADMTIDGEAMIHLLSDGSGDRAAQHPVNVTVLSLLLGKSLRLPVRELETLGVASLLHDIGKAQLPERVRWRDPAFTSIEDRVHQEHVNIGVACARAMGMSEEILQCIAQHHEMVDGSGFPLGLKGNAMTPVGCILALVNRYDNLCNPFQSNLALTPHEALALIYAQAKTRFDTMSLNAFVRLMGVYPPGSVVQLADERFALVMSVNSSRPLRPQVIVHDPEVPRDEALVVNLEETPQLGIKRSLKPLHLPQAAMSYLSPRKRISYFFEQASLGQPASPLNSM